MRKYVNLRFLITVTSLFLIVLAFGACGSPSANNGSKANGNANAADTNSNAATNSNKALGPVCNAVMDNGIIADLKAAIKPGSALYAKRRNFNFYVYGCNVWLVGHVGDLGSFKALYKMVSETANVRKTDLDGLFLVAGTGDVPLPTAGVCPGGTTKCNDICIPDNQQCHIGEWPPETTLSPTPAATRTP